jgi:hypothetical protein
MTTSVGLVVAGRFDDGGGVVDAIQHVGQAAEFQFVEEVEDGFRVKVLADAGVNVELNGGVGTIWASSWLR